MGDAILGRFDGAGGAVVEKESGGGNPLADGVVAVRRELLNGRVWRRMREKGEVEDEEKREGGENGEEGDVKDLTNHWG